jgi:hypothetical protein
MPTPIKRTYRYVTPFNFNSKLKIVAKKINEGIVVFISVFIPEKLLKFK